MKKNKIIELSIEKIKNLKNSGYIFNSAGTQSIFGYIKTDMVKFNNQLYTVWFDNKMVKDLNFLKL